MKKLLFTVLAVSLCILMCACTKPIDKEELVGEWSLENDDYVISISFTKEGTFGFAYVEVDGTTLTDFESGNGTYEIDGSKVDLDFKETNPFGSTVVTIEDGKLCIGDHELSKD